MRNTYPSDISCEKFEKIRLILESVRKKTKPRRLGLYELFCGVLYVLKSGCQWRMLPKEFQDGEIVTITLRNGVKKRMKIEKVF